MEDVIQELAEHIKSSSPIKGEALAVDIAGGEVELLVELKSLIKVLNYLKNDPGCRFEILIDVCGADYPDREKRFDVVYHLLSVTRNQRLRLKVQVGEGQAVPTVTQVYSSAGWYEREAWDFFGIPFSDHPDLRRILTDYGFDGHPLRKDFPLSGHVEVRYDDAQKRVVYEPVKLTQEFRSFDFLSPWEMAQYILPGDEKAQGDTAPDKSDDGGKGKS